MGKVTNIRKTDFVFFFENESAAAGVVLFCFIDHGIAFGEPWSFLKLFRAKAIDTSYRHHACMKGCMGEDFFGGKPHRDEALAKSR